MAAQEPIATPPQSIPIQDTAAAVLRPLVNPIASLRNEHSGTLGTFSPVNENGSFMFDRILKEGTLLKRTRKTKSWKPVYIVLRPNLLSIYKDKNESKLRHQINLSDLTAVARQKDPKKKVQHSFGLFSESRNFHFSTSTDKEAQQWVEIIRQESRLDQEDDEMGASHRSGTLEKSPSPDLPPQRPSLAGTGQRMSHDQGRGYSSSEADIPQIQRPTSVIKNKGDPTKTPQPTRRVSHSLDYSGPEQASYSEFSDTGMTGIRTSALSLQEPRDTTTTTTNNNTTSALPAPSNDPNTAISRPSMGQRVPSHQDGERVVFQGWLLLLKSRKRMRQWKKVWGVLRAKSLALYKDEEEYSAILVLPFSSIIDAMDIDPISRSKPYCMQVISEEHTYRFCTPDEEALMRWLGGFKSLLAKRKESQKQRAASPPQPGPQQA